MIAAVLIRRFMAAFAVLLIVAGFALRAPAPVDADIVIEQAVLRDGPRGTLLDVRAEVQLPIAVRQGLDSGVPLDFLVELSVKRQRPLLPDRRVRVARWSYRLVYYELTRHYRLGDRHGEDARNYRSLLAALEGLGELRALEVGEVPDMLHDALRGEVLDGVSAAVPLQATLTMRLDSRALPLPLQPLIGTAWRTRATPYVWRVQA